MTIVLRARLEPLLSHLMPIDLPYGRDANVSLDIDPESLVAVCDAPRGTPLADPATAVRAALTSPLDFPPLSAAVVPGDRVALALEPGVPQVAVIVAAVVEALVEAGVQPADITVLQTGDDPADDDPRRLLSDALRSAVVLTTHDPANREKLAYLAALPEGRPVYLNRLLCDADAIVPIGCLRTHEAVAYQGAYGGLYPMFSDQKTQRRYRNPGLIESESEMLARSRREVSSVGWLTGLQFTVQVVPGPSDSWLEVLAGELENVIRVGQQRCDAAWTYRVPRRADLVIGSIRGGSEQQTWDHLAAALLAAGKLVEDDGAIAMCTELASEPGPAVQNLATADDLDAAARHIRKERGEDTLSAIELIQVLSRARVYLLSRLDASFVEDLGLVAIEEADDIGRLAKRSSSCTVLTSANRAAVSVEEDA